jgi:hypothetical protein
MECAVPWKLKSLCRQRAPFDAGFARQKTYWKLLSLLTVAAAAAVAAEAAGQRRRQQKPCNAPMTF